MACFMVLRESGDGGFIISSPSFVFLFGGSFESLATIEKSEIQM